MTIDDALFYGVYLSQILLVSLYLPGRVVERARSLVATHPPAEFPKLYPVTVAAIGRALRLYRHLNLGVVVIGLALLAADLISGYTIDTAWVNWQEGEPYPIRNYRAVAFVSSLYTLLQYLLSIGLFACLEFRYFKRMKSAARARIRTAELKARRPFDFVSPALLGTAVAAYLTVAAFLLVLELPGNGTAIMIASLTVGNACATGCLFGFLYGRKHDPHQAREDRTRLMRGAWQCMAVVSILMSALFGIADSDRARGLRLHAARLEPLCPGGSGDLDGQVFLGRSIRPSQFRRLSSRYESTDRHSDLKTSTVFSHRESSWIR